MKHLYVAVFVWICGVAGCADPQPPQVVGQRSMDVQAAVVVFADDASGLRIVSVTHRTDPLPPGTTAPPVPATQRNPVHHRHVAAPAKIGKRPGRYCVVVTTDHREHVACRVPRPDHHVAPSSMLPAAHVPRAIVDVVKVPVSGRPRSLTLRAPDGRSIQEPAP